jgi:hypothetical protein
MIDRMTVLLVAAIAATPPTLVVLFALYKYRKGQTQSDKKIEALTIGMDGKVDALIRAARAEGRLEANEARDLLNGAAKTRADDLEQAREQGRQEQKNSSLHK